MIWTAFCPPPAILLRTVSENEKAASEKDENDQYAEMSCEKGGNFSEIESFSIVEMFVIPCSPA
jgi:ubiquitin